MEKERISSLSREIVGEDQYRAALQITIDKAKKMLEGDNLDGFLLITVDRNGEGNAACSGHPLALAVMMEVADKWKATSVKQVLKDILLNE